MGIKSLLLTLSAVVLLGPAAALMAAKEKPLPARRPPSRPPTIQESMKYQKKHGALAKAKRQKFRARTPGQ
jgi:hypothetical protein